VQRSPITSATIRTRLGTLAALRNGSGVDRFRVARVPRGMGHDASFVSRYCANRLLTDWVLRSYRTTCVASPRMKARSGKLRGRSCLCRFAASRSRPRVRPALNGKGNSVPARPLLPTVGVAASPKRTCHFERHRTSISRFFGLPVSVRPDVPDRAAYAEFDLAARRGTHAALDAVVHRTGSLPESGATH
jgi:hypothetical protein